MNEILKSSNHGAHGGHGETRLISAVFPVHPVVKKVLK
jgi:hypothetical protein